MYDSTVLVNCAANCLDEVLGCARFTASGSMLILWAKATALLMGCRSSPTELSLLMSSFDRERQQPMTLAAWDAGSMSVSPA